MGSASVGQVFNRDRHPVLQMPHKPVTSIYSENFVVDTTYQGDMAPKLSSGPPSSIDTMVSRYLVHARQEQEAKEREEGLKKEVVRRARLQMRCVKRREETRIAAEAREYEEEMRRSAKPLPAKRRGRKPKARD